MCVGFSTVRVTELWMPPRCPVICEPGTFTIFSCAWYIMHMPFMHALADDGARGNGAVQVEQFDPVIVDDTGLLRIGLREPDDRPAARQSQHQQIVGVGRVDAPFLVRRDEVEHDLRFRRCCACRASR